MGQKAAIVLAAGKSTRMRSDLPKVVHEVCGRPILAYVLSACRLSGVDRLIVVIGHGKEVILDRFSADRDVVWVEQAEQHGTGHAVACCSEALKGFIGSVFVVAGDMPLLRRDTVAALFEAQEASGDALVMATTELDNPTGYGRIVRDSSGHIEAIVEQRACTDEQLEICEVNPSYYCFDSERLFSSLDELSPSASGEIYLTDVVQAYRGESLGVSAEIRVAPQDAMGINTRVDLARVARLMQDRIQLRLMNEGVTIVDPDNTWVESDVAIGRDTVIYPFSFVGAGATIGERCRVGPHAKIAQGATVADRAIVEREASPGVSAT